MAGVCKLVHYRGTVQGVGFRATVLRLARPLAVHGYVKNLPDGRVELRAEGEASEVAALLDAVASRMAGYIQTADVRDEMPSGAQGFEIRR